MGHSTAHLFVESWSVCWTFVLGLGYIGRLLMLPELESLGSDRAASLMLLSSVGAVAALCFAGLPGAGLTISGWAIGTSLIRSIVLSRK